MPTYFEVTRHFRKLDDPHDGVASWMTPREAALTWQRVLWPTATDDIVLHAPSGSGKTTEVFREAERRRAAGAHAFAATATAISERGLRDALDQQSATAFIAWLQGSEQAVIFVDAVDELALRQRTLQDVLQRLDFDLPLTRRNVQLVFTVRGGTWQGEHTGQLNEFLRIARARRQTEAAIVEQPTAMPQQLCELKFAPLDRVAIRTLAIGYGVVDVDAFLDAVRREELDSLFEMRPRDVRWLVRKWNESKRLGKWSELLEAFCRTALEDEHPDRSRHRQLTVHEAQQGLQRVAAAVVLGKRFLLALPTEESSAATVSSRRLFEDWPTVKVQELFQTAVFVPKGSSDGDAQAVQLASEALLPFLAARWLVERVRRGLSVDRLVQLLMVRTFGEHEYHLPRARVPLAGWLVGHVAEFRNRCIAQRPDIVLFEGDPDLLSDADLEAALIAYARVQLEGGNELHATPGTVRKLARESLEPAAASLLATRPTTTSMVMLALEMAHYGRYRSCVPLALHLAADATQPDYVRAEARRVTIAAGSEEELASLAAIDDDSTRVRIVMLDLIPKTLHGAELVRFFAKGGEQEFRFYARSAVSRIADNDLERILDEVQPILDRSIVDSRTEPVFGAALPAVLEHLKRGLCAPASVRILLRILWLAEHAAIFISHDELDDLRDALARNTACRRAITDARLVAGTAGSYMSRQHKFCEPIPADLEWLVAQWNAARATEQAAATDDTAPSPQVQRSHLIELLIENLYQDADPSAKIALIATLPTQLVQRVEWSDARNAEFERRRIESEQERAAAAEATRARRIANLTPRVAAIEHGEDEDVYVAAFHYLGEPLRKKQTQRDFTRLADYFGESLVPSIIRGMKAYWRRHAPPMPDPADNRIEIRNLAGLVGLTLDIDDGLDVQTLSQEEVTRATTYALYELNALPYWFENLVITHDIAVSAVLGEAIQRAWSSTREAPTVIRGGADEPPGTSRVLRRLLLQMPVKRAGNRQAIEDAVDTLLTSADDRQRLLTLADAGLEFDANDDDRAAQWYRLLAHVNPLEAARRFEVMRHQAPQRFEHVLEKVAGYLEQDLSERKGRRPVSALLAPDALGAWLRLLLLGVVPEKDIKHRSGVAYSIGPRDHAQRLRDGCLDVLRADPTEAAHDVLAELIADPALARYSRMLCSAYSDQLESARDQLARPWTEDDVLAVERNDERRPIARADLFDLVRTHIVDIDRLISDGDDFSYRAIFSQHTDETQLQLWAASTLRQRARGLYEVIRENVVGQRKKVDISAVASGVGQLPIEIKPLGTYSLPELKRVVVEQLLGQYMQPADREYGILLLVRRDRGRWRHRRAWIGLAELCAELQQFASSVAQRHGKQIAVEAIDLIADAGSSAH